MTILKIILKRIKTFIRKLRKFWYYNFNTTHIINNLKKRKGSCKMCGQCCLGCYNLLTENNEGLRKCKEYNNRPRWCNADFPIDGLDLKLSGIKGCGYYWENKH